MMKKRFITTLILVLAFSSNLLAFQSEENKKGFTSIAQEDMKMHIGFLASDELEGRELCEPGSKVTAAYVAAQFEHFGLKPIGENNSYWQYFKVRRTGVDPAAASFNLHPKNGAIEELNLGSDYVVSRGNIIKSLPVVFAGYGLELEGYSDYEIIDVKDKLVLFFSHTPQEGQAGGKFSDPKYARDYSLYTTGRRAKDALKSKVNIARDKGAAGVIIVENPNHEHEKNYSSLKELMVNNVYSRKRYTLNLEERVSTTRIPQVWISIAAAEKIFKSAGKSMCDIQEEFDKTAQPNSFEIEGIEISFTSSGEKSIKITKNVVGLIEGSDPELKNEVVIIGAHYDHVGIINGVVYNGADDDASGTAGVMEIAEAFAKNEARPKRSILFIAFSGEEKGLLGSNFYANNPLFPIEKTAAMLQMDMIGRDEDIINLSERFRKFYKYKEPWEKAEDNVNALNILGTTFCNEMRTINEKSNENIKLELNFRYDDTPNIHASDHKPFLQKGIPSIFVFTGDHPDLHQPGDDIEKLNFPKMEKIVRLVYVTAWEIADKETRLSLDKPFK